MLILGNSITNQAISDKVTDGRVRGFMSTSRSNLMAEFLLENETEVVEKWLLFGSFRRAIV